jgi:hypothetical protein
MKIRMKQLAATMNGRIKQRTIFVLASLAILILSISVKPISAQDQTTAASNSDNINPDAVATLRKMGTYLRSLKVFQVEAATTRDEVLDDGQLVQRDSQVNLLARVPDRLRVEVTSPSKHRFFFYDGKTFTIFAQGVNYYATVPAPPTVGKLAAQLDEKYGIEIPLADLFYWGGPESKEADIKNATDVGPSEVGGVTCEHYAFRQEGLDWQVWIQMGDYPLPRKLVLTTLTDDARPQYSAVYTWNLAPSFNEAAFEFDPPKDAQKIAIAKQTSSASDTGSDNK